MMDFNPAWDIVVSVFTFDERPDLVKDEFGDGPYAFFGFCNLDGSDKRKMDVLFNLDYIKQKFGAELPTLLTKTAQLCAHEATHLMQHSSWSIDGQESQAYFVDHCTGRLFDFLLPKLVLLDDQPTKDPE